LNNNILLKESDDLMGCLLSKTVEADSPMVVMMMGFAGLDV
jgi:hypothetical protein